MQLDTTAVRYSRATDRLGIEQSIGLVCCWDLGGAYKRRDSLPCGTGTITVGFVRKGTSRVCKRRRLTQQPGAEGG